MEILGLHIHIFDEFEWDDERELISLEVNQKINTYFGMSSKIDLLT